MKGKYPKYNFVSNLKVYNILWCGSKVDFADISCEKPNITQLVIN
jgi:hypothetical protein